MKLGDFWKRYVVYITCKDKVAFSASNTGKILAQNQYAIKTGVIKKPRVQKVKVILASISKLWVWHQSMWILRKLYWIEWLDGHVGVLLSIRSFVRLPRCVDKSVIKDDNNRLTKHANNAVLGTRLNWHIFYFFISFLLFLMWDGIR